MGNVNYLLINADGFVARRCSVPPRLFPPADIPEGFTVLVAGDDQPLPPGPHRFDRRKLRGPVVQVASFADALSSWRPKEPSARAKLSLMQVEAIDRLDARYAARMAELRGPLAAVHADKRRQAEAGGGPLVVDEADRVAILANASAEDEAVAELERERRSIKARLRAASSEAEIAAILAEI